IGAKARRKVGKFVIEESNFSKKIFKKPRNQYEYDTVCEAETMLQKAIQKDSKEKVTEVQELLKLRAFVLRVVEEEDWKVAAKIPKPTPIEEPGEVEAVRGLPGQDEIIIHPTCPAYQNSYNKSATKQFNCYFCGGAGHIAAVYPSKSAEEQNNNNSWRYRSEQGGCKKNTPASRHEILDRKDRTPASSSLLVKELSDPVSKKYIEPRRKRGSKILQTNGRTK
ncbi:37006_t:CDS:2, partial [Racocetra persica]